MINYIKTFTQLSGLIDLHWIYFFFYSVTLCRNFITPRPRQFGLFSNYKSQTKIIYIRLLMVTIFENPTTITTHLYVCCLGMELKIVSSGSIKVYNSKYIYTRISNDALCYRYWTNFTVIDVTYNILKVYQYSSFYFPFFEFIFERERWIR